MTGEAASCQCPALRLLQLGDLLQRDFPWSAQQVEDQDRLQLHDVERPVVMRIVCGALRAWLHTAR